MVKKLLVALSLLITCTGYALPALATEGMSGSSGGHGDMPKQVEKHDEEASGDIPVRFLWTIAVINGLAITSAAYLKYSRKEGDEL